MKDVIKFEKLSLNPNEEDDFIDEDISMREYLKEIVTSFKETSNNQFILNFDQDANSKKITKSIEIIYGLRNFIGNANKFCTKKIYIFLKSNNQTTEVIIEDDGEGYPADILSKIGEPYLKTPNKINKKIWSGLRYIYWKNFIRKKFCFN